MSSPVISLNAQNKAHSLLDARTYTQSSDFPPRVQARRASYPRETVNGYEIRMLGYTAVLPVAIAAEFMQELWTNVVREANLKFQQNSREELFEVSFGLVVASFQALDGPLDWQTVSAFAAKAANEAKNGHSGLWRVALSNHVTNAVIGVVLVAAGITSVPFGYGE